MSREAFSGTTTNFSAPFAQARARYSEAILLLSSVMAF